MTQRFMTTEDSTRNATPAHTQPCSSHQMHCGTNHQPGKKSSIWEPCDINDRQQQTDLKAAGSTTHGAEQHRRRQFAYEARGKARTQQSLRSGAARGAGRGPPWNSGRQAGVRGARHPARAGGAPGRHRSPAPRASGRPRSRRAPWGLKPATSRPWTRCCTVTGLGTHIRLRCQASAALNAQGTGTTHALFTYQNAVTLRSPKDRTDRKSGC